MPWPKLFFLISLALMVSFLVIVALTAPPEIGKSLGVALGIIGLVTFLLRRRNAAMLPRYGQKSRLRIIYSFWSQLSAEFLEWYYTAVGLAFVITAAVLWLIS